MQRILNIAPLITLWLITKPAAKMIETDDNQDSDNE